SFGAWALPGRHQKADPRNLAPSISATSRQVYSPLRTDGGTFMLCTMDRLWPGAPARAGLLVLILLLLAIVGSGCRLIGSGGGNRQVTIKAQDTMRFDPASVTVPVGQTVQVTLMNNGDQVHDFVLTDGVDQPVKLEAAGKSSAGGTFTIARAGTYTYVCAQP